MEEGLLDSVDDTGLLNLIRELLEAGRNWIEILEAIIGYLIGYLEEHHNDNAVGFVLSMGLCSACCWGGFGSCKTTYASGSCGPGDANKW